MQSFIDVSKNYLNILCLEITDRSVGSAGNRAATQFYESELKKLGWKTESPEFDVMDWRESGASLIVGSESFNVQSSPYSLGCDCSGQLVAVSTVMELQEIEISGKVVLLHGDIAAEQIMPKNFVFYNPEEHQKLIALLEEKAPLALITATGRNAALAGGVYPFPMFEDGDFDIPSVFMTEEEGERLSAFVGQEAHFKSECERIPASACNVIARKDRKNVERIVITAHIDAKKGSPGAIDNATGVIVLLLLGRLLQDYAGERIIELVAFNGEDYYAASGQMHYIAQNQNNFDDVLLDINIDGAGYKEGRSAFSLFDMPQKLDENLNDIIDSHANIIEGPQWPQGDHSIFLQYGRPALAVSSEWFLDNIDAQDITHTEKDHPDIVDCSRLVEIAEALKEFIIGL